MQKQLSARLCSLVALAAAMFLACPACEKPPEAAPPTKESRPSLEIRPEGPAKIGEPAIVGREAGFVRELHSFPERRAHRRARAPCNFIAMSRPRAPLSPPTVSSAMTPLSRARSKQRSIGENSNRRNSMANRFRFISAERFYFSMKAVSPSLLFHLQRPSARGSANSRIISSRNSSADWPIDFTMQIRL